MTRMHVATLGRLRIQRDGQEVRELPAQPVRCALFLYLALERSATRDELVALLWPERDGERARRSLSQTLYELRLGLGDGWIRSHRDQVEISPAVTVDALEFMAAVAEARDEEAMALYDGAFLEGCHLVDSAAFQSWADRHRSRLGRLHRELCRRLTGARAAAGDLAGALVVARRWADLDPLEDEAHHHIISLLAQTGRRSEALRHFDAYAELIARELEVEPLDQTRELVDRIREGAVAEEPAGPDASAPVDGREPAADPPPAGHSERRAGVARTGMTAPAVVRRRAHGRLLAAVAVGVVAAVAALWGGAKGVPHWGVSGEESPLDSGAIAVLPFANLSAEPEQEYFAEGITEDLLTNLSRIGGLRVISRTSVMRYRRTEVPIGEIARELGVRYILEGSVRREDDRVRITAQLIDAASDTHLWAEAYDRELTGVFQIQGEIARRIVEQLRHRLPPAPQARAAGGETASIVAYDLLLRGRQYLSRPGAADVRKFRPAMNYFRQALEIDPEYARAYVGLSQAFLDNVVLPITLRRDSALFYARRAAELDPESAEAAAALGQAHLVARQRRLAEQAFRRALELDPNQVEALEGLARLSWVHGRFDQAVLWQRQAVAVDPFDAEKLAVLGAFLLDIGDLDGAERAYRRSAELAPDAPASSFMLAQIFLIRGQAARAEGQMRALEAAASDHPGTRFLLGRFHAQRGRLESAAAELAAAAEVLGGGVRATVSLQRAYVAKKLGQIDRAAALLEVAEAELAEREREGARSPRLRLQLHALRGERDAAAAILGGRWELESGGDLLAGPQMGLYWLDQDPLLEELRTDSTFRMLLGRQRAQRDSMRLRLERM